METEVILRYVVFFIFGIVSGTSKDTHINTWRFWVLLGLLLAIQFLTASLYGGL